MIFMPPRYQLVLVLSERTNKLPYWKLQYPTCVKDTDLDVHIRVFKKTIRANGETMEVDMVNLFGFILWYNILEWGKIILTASLMN
jgi:hypothetical protein